MNSTLIKSAEFIEYVQIGPGRNVAKVTADTTIVLELCFSPVGVVVDGRVFVPMNNVKFIELLPESAAADLSLKASSMLIKVGEEQTKGVKRGKANNQQK